MIPSVLKFLFICLEVVLLFNLLILVHELGHFLAAKWRGLVVEKFAVWFGKPIWSKTINGVEYRLGCIPAGGYVAIPQLAPMEVLEGQVETDRSQLPPVKPLDKIIVAAAGPAFSLGLAFLMAVMVYFVGKPESVSDMPIIGMVAAGGPAEKAGLKPGDEILKVDGQPVTRFMSGTDSVKWRIIRSEGETIPFEIRRGSEMLTVNSGWTKPETAGWRRPALRQVQFGPRFVPGINFVARGSVADKAGLKSGDLIKTANGQAIFNLEEIIPILTENAGKPIPLTVERAGQTVALTLPVPATSKEKPDAVLDLGVDWGQIIFSHPSPWSQVSDAATSIFRMVGALLSPKSDVKAAHFSGPVGIMKLYYQVFATNYGLQLALSLSVLINVNLALLNLLPFPVLDGGHITLAIVEGIRRKPINVRVLEVVQTACALLLIGFMVYVTFFDVGDFVPEGKKAKTEDVQPREMSLVYTPDIFAPRRRTTREVKVGAVGVGGSNPIRVQSMITCDTMDTAASIQQTQDLAAVGCEIVRITAPTVKDAANLEHIVLGLRAQGCETPIVADIHFKPEAAMEAAQMGGEGARESRQLRGLQKIQDHRIHRCAVCGRVGNASVNGFLRWSDFVRNMAARCALVQTTAA